MRKFVCLLVIFLLTSTITLTGQKKVRAEAATEIEDNGTLSTANPLDLQGSSADVVGTINDGEDEDYYRFDLPAPGTVKIDLSVNYITRHKVTLLSKDGTVIESWNTRFMNSQDLVNIIDIGLAQGTYYVKISLHENTELVNKPYTLKVGFTENKASEKEVNNTAAEANPIDLNTPIIATFSGYQDNDFYQINIPKDMTLTILTTRPYESTYSFKFFNLDSSVSESVNTEHGQNTSLTKLLDIKVKAGTYYVQTKPLSLGVSTFERYSFKLIEKDLIAPAPPKVSPITDKSTMISGSAEAFSTIFLKPNDPYNDYKYQLGKADKKGNFKLYIPKLRGGIYVNVTAKDSTGNESKSTILKVKDTTAPGAPTVNKLTSKSTYVTGKSEPYANVNIKKGSKNLASGKADSKGIFKIKIAQLKQKTSLFVFATDSSGNRSKAAVIKVKDITAPSVPSVSKVTSKSTYVTGKSEPYAKIQIKKGCQCIAYGRADSKGKFKIKMDMQKHKTKLYVYAIDSSGNRSKARVVVVK